MHTEEYLKENGIDIEQSLGLLGDLETYDDILQEFLDHIEERRTKLHDCLNNSDMENYEIEVHALKSDSKYLGFTSLANMALEHQNKSHDGDVEYVSSHYDELSDEVTKFIDIMKKYVNG